MNSIFFNEIEDAKCIKIYLRKKINEKALNDTLIKLGLTSMELTNSKGTDKLFYLKPFFNEDGSIFGSDLNISKKSLIIASENLLFISYDMIWDYFDFIDGYNIVNLLLDYEVIDRDEVYTKSGDIRAKHKIHDIDINGIVEKIEYRDEEWNDNSRELALIKHFIKFLMDKYKEELSLSENNSKNEAEKEEIKEQNKELNIEKLNPIIKQCENKINEIKEIIKDFDYSDKKTYEEATSKIEKDLEELENKDISVSRVNEIIDEINETYKNAYKKKNNVSALSYIMETDEDIDLIKKIDIDNL